MGGPSTELAQAVFHILDWRGIGFLDCPTLHRFALLSGFSAGEAEWRQEFSLLCKEKGCSVRHGLDKRSFVQLLSEDFFVDESELLGIFNQLVQSLPEPGLGPDPALRSILKKTIFALLKAKSGNSYLGSLELRCFAELSGFTGTEEDWELEFELLCKGASVADRQISQAMFLRLVDDTSDSGCYCSDTELLDIYRWLLDSMPALRQERLVCDSPEEEKSPLCEDRAEKLASPIMERPTVSEQCHQPVTREMTFRDILGLLSKGGVDVHNIDLGRFWEVCATADLQKFADMLDESGFIRTLFHDEDAQTDQERLQRELSLARNERILAIRECEEARAESDELRRRIHASIDEQSLSLTCNERTRAIRECEEARAESDKLRRRIHASIDEQSNALADAMVCKLECAEAEAKLQKFRLQEGELTDKLYRMEQDEESRIRKFRNESQGLESELRQQTLCMQEVVRSFQKDSSNLQENSIRLEAALESEQVAREDGEMQQAILQGTLVGMESEWLQVEALLWNEVRLQEENSDQRFMQLEAMESTATALTDGTQFQVLEQMQDKYEIARAANAKMREEEQSLHMILEMNAAEAETKLRRLRVELEEHWGSISAEYLVHLEGVEARCREEEEYIMNDAQDKCERNFQSCLSLREEYADLEYRASPGNMMEDAESEDAFAERAAQFELCLSEARANFEVHVSVLQEELLQAKHSNEHSLQSLRESISADHVDLLESVEAKCTEKEECIVNEAQEMCMQILHTRALEHTEIQSQCLILKEEYADLECRTSPEIKTEELQTTSAELVLEQEEDAFAQRVAQFEMCLAEVRANFEAHVSELQEELVQARNSNEDSLNSLRASISADHVDLLESVEATCREEEERIVTESQEKCEQILQACALEHTELQSQCLSLTEEYVDLQRRFPSDSVANDSGNAMKPDVHLESSDSLSEAVPQDDVKSEVADAPGQQHADSMQLLRRQEVWWEDAFAQREAQYELGLNEAHANFETHMSQLYEELGQERKAKERIQNALDASAENSQMQEENISAHVKAVEVRCKEEEDYAAEEARVKCEQAFQTFDAEHADMLSQCTSLREECVDLQGRVSSDDLAEHVQATSMDCLLKREVELEDAFARRSAQFELGLKEAQTNFEAHISQLQEELVHERTKSVLAEDSIEDFLTSFRENEQKQWENISASYLEHLEGVEMRCREEELHVVSEAQGICEQTSHTYAAENAEAQSKCLSLEQELEHLHHSSVQLELKQTDSEKAFTQRAAIFESELTCAHAKFEAHIKDLKGELEDERLKAVATPVEDPFKLKVELKEVESEAHELQQKLSLQRMIGRPSSSCANDLGTLEQLRAECEAVGHANIRLQDEELHMKKKLRTEAEESEAMRVAYAMALPFSGEVSHSKSEFGMQLAKGFPDAERPLEILVSDAHLSQHVLSVEFQADDELQVRDFMGAPLGMTFHDKLPMTVKEVRIGGHAEKNGVQSGWTITKIGEVSIKNMGVKEIMDLLKEKVSALPKSTMQEMLSPVSASPRRLEPRHYGENSDQSKMVADFSATAKSLNDADSRGPLTLNSSRDGSKVEAALNRQLSAVLQLNRH